ncbi:gamma-glutamyl-gamma-aminobutyrate hydrolase family protein [Thermocatellispora tengchongensis]|uniref:gamma-glutamyl-gamma-aminobutyrate hydrolase family protein n=1 Tax=Thermocatellispora tengchongensis TaxID=1073253 RepID=UPI003640E605
MRPLIGITCYVETARYTVWEARASLLPHDYVEQVARAGGQPVILPPAGEPAALVERLDGLILAGGGDIDPGRYGAEPHPRTGYVRGFRDDAEFALAGAALERELPFLGVCRGLQVLNVALGGTLHQHLPDVVGHSGHSPRRASSAPCRCARCRARRWPGSATRARSCTTTIRPSTGRPRG